MVGLMPQPQEQMSPPQGQQGVAPEAGYEGDPNVTPEEQAAYERFVDNGLKIIANEKMAPHILKRIQEAEQPAEGLAAASVNIIVRLEQSAQENGRQLDPAILLHGGQELLEAIANMATAFDVHAFTEKEIESALYIAMDQYGTQAVANGTLNKDALSEDVSMLQEADQSGNLDGLFGQGFTEHANGLGQEQAARG